MIGNKLNSNTAVLIYGAGLMGRSLITVLREQPYEAEIRAVLVRSAEENPAELLGISVLLLGEAEGLHAFPVLVALHEKYLAGAVKDLKAAGFSKIIPVSFDSDRWTDFREAYLRTNCRDELPENVCFLDELSATNEGFSRAQAHIPDESLTTAKDFSPAQAAIYVVHSVADRALAEQVTDRQWEIPIQVGAARTPRKIYELTDAIGDNISNLNSQFCHGGDRGKP